MICMKNNFMYIFSIIVFFCPKTFGQDKKMLVTGKVSFVTSKNVYVKFTDTKNIHIGDTLKFLNQIKACLLVKNKSSRSVICNTLFDCDIKKGDEVYISYTIKIDKKREEKNIIIPKINKRSTTVKSLVKNEINSKNIENIRGKLSVSSYSNLTSDRADKHRMLYRFSINANHINNSKLSFESYLNYRQYIQSSDNSSYQNKNVFNIYNLALKYDIDPTLSLTVGRKINNKTSSLGAIDGIQAEKYFGKNYIGVIAGFRPDITDYGFNSNLLEYGGYIGRTSSNKNSYSQTTLGAIEQRNGNQSDRRYAYFQHSSTFMKKLNLFSSVEFDVYNNGNSKLTNLYTSAKYKFSRKFNLMLSFDSRKRIIYHTSFQTEVDRLLNDNEARQGVRLRMNIKPHKYLYTGFSYSKRFQSSNQNKSDNINGYISWSKIPNIGGRLSLNFNRNKSSYLESTVLSIRHSRELINNKLSAGFYFRIVDYNYFNNNTSSKQNYYGTNLSLRISKTLKLNIFGELSTSSNLNNNYRINTAIVKRFKSKRKK